MFPTSFVTHYIAVCTLPCANGGTCTEPEVCSCTSHWQGSTCEQGTLYYHDSVIIISYAWLLYIYVIQYQ